jgi:hypothetical protein
MHECQTCGMICYPGEYHPYAACLMFKACHNGDEVRANLNAVQADTLRTLSEEAAEQIHLAKLQESRDV